MFTFGPASRGGVFDPYWSNVVLLVTADGNIGDAPEDHSRFQQAPAVSTNVVITAASGKFNGKSFGASVGITDLIRFPMPSSDQRPLTEAFTLEYWVAKEVSGTSAGDHFLFYAVSPASSGNYIRFNTDTQLGYLFQFSGGGGGGVAVASLGTTWHHMAMVRSAGLNSVRHYMDGSLLGTRTIGTASWNNIDGVRICGDGGGRFSGYIDQFRLTKGVERYTGSSYTVPTEPFPVG